MSVKDLVVVITGAARGMGREYARAFLANGAKIVATDLSWEPSGFSSDDFRFDEELRGSDRALVEVMDITIDHHVRRVFNAAMERFGTVDVLICNAGMRNRDLYIPHGSATLLETEVSEWQRMFETHVYGNVRVIKQFTPPMLAKRRGSVITVASGGYNASRPDSQEMPYMAAKSALVTLTLYLAHELKPSNVAANVILPGHTRTTGSDEMDVAKRERRAARGDAPSLRPLRYNPDNPVPLALHLAEQDASTMTGKVINALEWNETNGFGGFEKWAYEEDLKAPDVRKPSPSR